MSKIVAVFLFVLLFSSCNLVFYAAEYSVTGGVTHADINFDGTTYINQALPWSYFKEYERSGRSFFLSAQSNDALGDLTVMLTLDEVPYMSQTTAAPFGYVAIYGEIP